jgi:hypothetical protein
MKRIGLDAVNDYYNNIDVWKEKYLPKENKHSGKRLLDRHKVASLSAHYFLKHRPLIPGKKANGTGIFLIANEFVSIFIALSRLDEGDKPYNLSDKLSAALIKAMNEHMKSMQKDFKGYQPYIPNFIHIISTLLYSIEKRRMPG